MSAEPRDKVGEPSGQPGTDQTPEADRPVTGDVERRKLKSDNITRFLNKFRTKDVVLEHIRADLAKYDVEVCHPELAQAVVENIMFEQEPEKAMKVVGTVLTESPGFAPFFTSKVSIEINQKTDLLNHDPQAGFKSKRIFRFLSNCFQAALAGFYDRFEGPVLMLSSALKSPHLATLEQKMEFLVSFCAQVVPRLSEKALRESLVAMVDEEVETVCRVGVLEVAQAAEDFFRMKKELQEVFRRQGKVDATLAQGIENLQDKVRKLSAYLEGSAKQHQRRHRHGRPPAPHGRGPGPDPPVPNRGQTRPPSARMVRKRRRIQKIQQAPDLRRAATQSPGRKRQGTGEQHRVQLQPQRIRRNERRSVSQSGPRLRQKNPEGDVRGFVTRKSSKQSCRATKRCFFSVGRWPPSSRTSRKLTSADFTELAEAFTLKVGERIREEIVGVNISPKSLLEISLLCHLAKFCVLDENPIINLILRWRYQSHRKL